MLSFYIIPPPTTISYFVRYCWVLEGKGTSDKPFVHRALADTCPEFLFYYKGLFKRIIQHSNTQACFRSGIYGPMQSYAQYLVDEDFGIFGVCLYPYAISQLFSLPTSDVSNHCPDLTTLCGKDGETLEEKMMLAASNAERLVLVSDFLTKRMAHAKRQVSAVSKVIRMAITQDQPWNISELANECNLSRRQFERSFRENAGFSPRLFLNLARFGHLVNNKSARTSSLTDVAYRYGYYDQSHFIRHFTQFSGYSPKEYFRHIGPDADEKATTEFRL